MKVIQRKTLITNSKSTSNFEITDNQEKINIALFQRIEALEEIIKKLERKSNVM